MLWNATYFRQHFGKRICFGLTHSTVSVRSNGNSFTSEVGCRGRGVSPYLVQSMVVCFIPLNSQWNKINVTATGEQREAVTNNFRQSNMNTLLIVEKQMAQILALERIPHISQQHKWHGGQIPE